MFMYVYMYMYAFKSCILGECRSCEEARIEVNVLKMEAEERKKEMEELKMALEKQRTGTEEGLRESQENNKDVKELIATLNGKKKELEEKDRELEETKRELDELNKLVEEKSREADECMDKYCSLMVSFHKLEETSDAMKTRLEQITVSQRAKETNSNSNTDSRRRSTRKSSSKLQVEKMESNTENMAPLIPEGSPQGSSSGKRGHRDISDKDGAQEALHNLTKKIKAHAMTTPKPRTEQDDEEFRPEGLPELVQKGWCCMYLKSSTTVCSLCWCVFFGQSWLWAAGLNNLWSLNLYSQRKSFFF